MATLVIAVVVAVLTLGHAPPANASDASDTLGLNPQPEEVQRFTLGTDVFEVWTCNSQGPVPISAQDWVVDAEAELSPYFEWWSDNRYHPEFIVGGTVPSGEDCAVWARTHASGTANAAVYLLNSGGGLATPGLDCSNSTSSCPTTFPDNAREGYIGVSGSNWSTAAHEIGHMLSWPHSNTGSGDDYDVANDLMSGNWAKWMIGSWWVTGSLDRPYATIALNRYTAGWINSTDVFVWNGGTDNLVLSTNPAGGTQALVVDTGGEFYVFGGRSRSPLDPIPEAWNGVEAYRVERCPSCWGLGTVVTPEPAVPFDRSDLDAYDEPLPHVLTVGTEIEVGDARVRVVDASTNPQTGLDDYVVVVESRWPPTTFDDVSWPHTFRADVEWLAAADITRGCNPPANTMFCPDDPVTRGQIAAFFVRALDLKDAGSGDLFDDDNESTFETEIDKLAAAGITRGCNPGEGNTKFCPDDPVTRGQLAAFFVRAFGYVAGAGSDVFVDDDASIFEHDIERLAAAGVTKGCNPPENDRFCPDAAVTRAEIAAFFHRAIG